MKKRKRGMVLFETLATIPIVIMVIFGSIELFNYMLANKQTNEAAQESARMVSTTLRDHTGLLRVGSGDPPLSQADIDDIHLKLEKKVKTIMSLSGFTTFNYDEVHFVTDENGNAEEACIEAMKNNGQVICLYIKESNGVDEKINERKIEQVVVKIRTGYNSISQFFPIVNWARVEGIGVEKIDRKNRFEYYK